MDLNFYLLYYSFNGNVSEVLRLISEGADVNSEDQYGRSSLFEALCKGHKHICEILIANGADVNHETNESSTCLMYASYKGHKEICELLIPNGADVNAVDQYGRSCLFHAIQGNRKEICKVLIANGADMNIVTNDGYSPFIFALNKDNKEICELLVANGVDWNQQKFSIFEKNPELFDLLLKAGPNTSSERIYAIMMNRKNVYKYMFESCKDLVLSEDEKTGLFNQGWNEFAESYALQKRKHILGAWTW